MNRPMQAELVLGALSAMSQAASARHAQRHELALAELRAGVLAHMADALVTKRVEVVRDGFHAILLQYDAQARHLMEQQAKYGDAELAASDARRRIEIAGRIKDIDGQLGLIRASAQLMYDSMTEVILLIGGSANNFAKDVAGSLQLNSM